MKRTREQPKNNWDAVFLLTVGGFLLTVELFTYS